ncbi:discoidin domain-containing protein, partial [Bacteroidota bacterium]
VAQTYSGGTGTSADPYQIRTAQDLMDLDTATMQWAGDTIHWKLTLDIDMTGKVVTSIGYKGMPFMGTFDGNNKIISNLTMSDANAPVGLFGLVNGGSVMNLGVEDISITTTKDTVGGIVGHLVEGSLTNCYVQDGTVDGGTSVGALVGAMSDTSMVKNCLANIVVKATSTGGGLIGNIATGDTNNVSMCVNYGTVNVGWAIADTVGIVTYGCYYLDTTASVRGDMNPMNVQLDSTLAVVDTNYKMLDFNVWTMQMDGPAMLKSFTVPNEAEWLKTGGWKATVDPAGGSATSLAIDMNTGTQWGSDWENPPAAWPFIFTVELGREAEITHFTYVPRQDAWGPNGTVKGYKFYMTKDTSAWGTPVVQGQLPVMADYKTPHHIKLPAMDTATWVRFQVDSCVSSPKELIIAELKLFGRYTGNAAPIADAGTASTSCFENPGDTVQLNGSGMDYDEDKITFAWTAPAGITLTDATIANPKWAADSGATADAKYKFYLIVNDGTDDSAPDSVEYTIKPNHLPVVTIGKPQTVKHSEWVPLSSSGTDADCHDLTFAWTAPAGITLVDGTTANPRFKAPRVLTDTKYDFTVAVSDPYGTVTANTSVTVIWSNVAPVADAGPPQEFVEGTVDTVWLDASKSKDFDGDTISYSWTAPVGITLSDSTAIKPYWDASNIDVDADSVLVFSLVVNDGHLSSDAATVNITILRDATAISSLEAIDVSVYPNPSDGMFKVVSPSSLDVYVMDILGRTLFTDHFEEGMNTIDLSSFGQGLYILTVREGKNISSMKLRVK